MCKYQKKIIRILIPSSFVIILYLWSLITPEGLLGKADAIGYAVCHRISVRSFFFGTSQMPMCARCTGMYLGTACTLIFQSVISRRKGAMPTRRVVIVMLGLTILWVIDGVNSYMHLFPTISGLYEPNNIYRLLTGSGMGIVAAVMLYPAFQQTMWSNWIPEPAIDGIRQLGILLLLTFFVDFIVLLKHPFVLLVASLLSTAFVLVLLTMVYSMLLVIVFKVENQWSRIQEAWLPLLAGLTVALTQIAILDWIRLGLTNSWQGIPFPP